MSYEVIVDRRPRKFIDDLSVEMIGRTFEALAKLANNPRPPGSKKLRDRGGEWSLRSGDIRLLYRIDDTAKVVNVTDIDYRDKAYKRKD